MYKQVLRGNGLCRSEKHENTPRRSQRNNYIREESSNFRGQTKWILYHKVQCTYIIILFVVIFTFIFLFLR